MHEPTISFSIHEDKEQQMKAILTEVYDALRQKGYNPINQIVGYILSEDPTYITTHNNARSLIRRIDRDELLQMLVKSYLNDSRLSIPPVRRNCAAQAGVDSGRSSLRLRRRLLSMEGVHVSDCIDNWRVARNWQSMRQDFRAGKL